MIDIIVTRHKGLVEFLKEEKLVTDNVKVVLHATEEDVKNKHVIGVLPRALSCLTASFTEIPLEIPYRFRGTELSVNQIREFAGEPVTYSERRWDWNIFCEGKRVADLLKGDIDVQRDATRLRTGWAIRPKGQLGTCGWINGEPWTVIYLPMKPDNIPEREED